MAIGPALNWQRYGVAVEVLMFLSLIPTLALLIDTRTRLGDESNILLEDRDNLNIKNIEKDESEEEMANKINEMVNISIFQVALGFCMLIISMLCTVAKSGQTCVVSLPPLLNQLALMGLIPLQVLQMPIFPLLSLNIALLVGLTITNFVFLVRQAKHIVILIVFIVVYTAIGFLKRSLKHSGHPLFTVLGFNESIEFMAPDNLSKAYLVHFFAILLGLLFLNGLAAFKIRITEQHRISEQGI